MKKMLAIFTTIVLLLIYNPISIAEISVSPFDEEDAQKIFDEHGIYGGTYFDNYFVEYYTPEEYVNLSEMVADMSASLKWAISNQVIVVKQTISTFNSSETKYLIIDRDGTIIYDYGNNSWIANVSTCLRIGDYAFVSTNGNPARHDIIDKTGAFVSQFETGQENEHIEELFDLGNEYYIFSTILKEKFQLYILTPAGEIFPASRPSSLDYYIYYPDITDKLIVGKINEDLYSVLYIDSSSTAAYYCNNHGKRVIDLSSEETGYYVTELGNFDKGVAMIELRGADGKNYVASIDTSGQFVEGPVQK